MAPPTQSSTDAAAVAAVCSAHGLDPSDFSRLAAAASSAKETAYCPYSKFRVGAAVLTGGGDGKPSSSAGPGAVVTGCNVENASYPVGTCAERVALGRAVAEGHRGGFRAIAVATDISPPASPCGMCRQFIREFLVLEAPIILFDAKMDFVVVTLEQLLPMSFGPEHLGHPTSS